MYTAVLPAAFSRPPPTIQNLSILATVHVQYCSCTTSTLPVLCYECHWRSAQGASFNHRLIFFTQCGTRRVNKQGVLCSVHLVRYCTYNRRCLPSETSNDLEINWTEASRAGAGDSLSRPCSCSASLLACCPDSSNFLVPRGTRCPATAATASLIAQSTRFPCPC